MLFSRSLVVAALSLAMILIGVNSQSGWLFWLAGLLLSALLVSWTTSVFEVRKLSLTRRHRSEVNEEETLEVTLVVENHGRFSRNLLEVIDEDPCDSRPHKRPRLKPARKTLRAYLRDPSPPQKGSPAANGGRAALLIPRVEAGSEIRLSYERGGMRRGLYGGWPGFFYSEGIIGLARHARRARADSRLVVLPHYEELRSFPLVDSFLYPQKTPLEYSSKGAGMDYYGVREFRAGDPLQHVHWRTTARRGELVVKEFERETGTPLVILIDNQAGNGAGRGGNSLLDSEARLAASVTRYAHYAGHPVILASYRGASPVLYDVPGFHACLEWLAALLPEGGIGLEEQVEGLRSELEPGVFFCCIVPARAYDFGRIAAALPPLCHVALVLVDASSHGGNGPSDRIASSPEKAVSNLLSAPFPGLFSVSVYRKGDGLGQCLEKPLIIYGGLPPRGR